MACDILSHHIYLYMEKTSSPFAPFALFALCTFFPLPFALCPSFSSASLFSCDWSVASPELAPIWEEEEKNPGGDEGMVFAFCLCTPPHHTHTATTPTFFFLPPSHMCPSLCHLVPLPACHPLPACLVGILLLCCWRGLPPAPAYHACLTAWPPFPGREEGEEGKGWWPHAMPALPFSTACPSCLPPCSSFLLIALVQCTLPPHTTHTPPPPYHLCFHDDDDDLTCALSLLVDGDGGGGGGVPLQDQMDIIIWLAIYPSGTIWVSLCVGVIRDTYLHLPYHTIKRLKRRKILHFSFLMEKEKLLAYTINWEEKEYLKIMTVDSDTFSMAGEEHLPPFLPPATTPI